MFGFFKGLGTYRSAMDALNRYHLWGWVIGPGVISLLLGGLAMAAGILYTDDLAAWLAEQWPFETGEEVFEVAMNILAVIVTVVLVLLSLKYIVMVIVAPFMGTLSEKLEESITGKPIPDASFGQVMKDIGRALSIALRNIVRELFYILLITIAGLFIPVIGQIVSAILIFLVQSYYIGFGNIDCYLERKRYTVSDTVNFVNSYRWTIMGNGTGFMLLLLIPVVGLLLAPGLGTAAATINGLEALDKVKYQPEAEF